MHARVPWPHLAHTKFNSQNLGYLTPQIKRLVMAKRFRSGQCAGARRCN